MRTIQWLFVVSVALFVGGVAFIVAGARNAETSSPVADVPETTPVASIKQIMNGIVMPNALVIYNSVATNVTAAGVEEIAPKNDAEWAAIGDSAGAVVEAGNLLLIGDRTLDKGDWVTMTREFMDAGKRALDAAAAQDKDAIVEAGGDLNTTCDNCHARYQRQ